VAVIEAHRSAPEWADAAWHAYTIGEEAPAPGPLILQQLGD